MANLEDSVVDDPTVFEVTGVDSDEQNYVPYPVRLVCSTSRGGGTKLIVWGAPDQMENVDCVREATKPCYVTCDWTHPPDYARNRGEVAWVEPGRFLKVL